MLSQAVWYLKCRALTLKNWIDDTEIEEEGIADALLDEHQTAQVARPGTSLARPMTGAQVGDGWAGPRTKALPSPALSAPRAAGRS
jgi:hypothetical protein